VSRPLLSGRCCGRLDLMSAPAPDRRRAVGERRGCREFIAAWLNRRGTNGQDPPVARIDEYFRDPHAPPAGGLVVVVYAVVRDGRERVLLVRRIDDDNWELPGGRVEVGETATSTLVREVAEESGIRIEPTGISGIYSDPSHIVVYAVEGALQQFAVCFHAFRVDPDNLPPRPDGIETSAAAWFAPADIRALRMHPEVRRRLDDALRPAASPRFD
jgi:8-oxo-dGTP pyrophosphatase MutT (NUDIX family)